MRTYIRNDCKYHTDSNQDKDSTLIEEYEPARCYLLFYYTYDRRNMSWALLRPSSGAHDYSADYHIGRLVLGLMLVGS